jgi:WhiB family redox-sensing transcriptional regulator|tara:strand:- start:257 stop:511 length:255 start_codon:yes stop_codon:yes gene_type:complete
MTNRRQTAHQRLQHSINEVGSVPCMDNPAVFFPEDYPNKEEREQTTRIARDLCNKCPIKEQCFEYAVEAQEPYGIWAGTLPSER